MDIESVHRKENSKFRIGEFLGSCIKMLVRQYALKFRLMCLNTFSQVYPRPILAIGVGGHPYMYL